MNGVGLHIAALCRDGYRIVAVHATATPAHHLCFIGLVPRDSRQCSRTSRKRITIFIGSRSETAYLRSTHIDGSQFGVARLFNGKGQLIGEHRTVAGRYLNVVHTVDILIEQLHLLILVAHGPRDRGIRGRTHRQCVGALGLVVREVLYPVAVHKDGLKLAVGRLHGLEVDGIDVGRAVAGRYRDSSCPVYTAVYFLHRLILITQFPRYIRPRVRTQRQRAHIGTRGALETRSQRITRHHQILQVFIV